MGPEPLDSDAPVPNVAQTLSQSLPIGAPGNALVVALKKRDDEWARAFRLVDEEARRLASAKGFPREDVSVPMPWASWLETLARDAVERPTAAAERRERSANKRSAPRRGKATHPCSSLFIFLSIPAQTARRRRGESGDRRDERDVAPRRPARVLEKFLRRLLVRNVEALVRARGAERERAAGADRVLRRRRDGRRGVRRAGPETGGLPRTFESTGSRSYVPKKASIL